MAVFDVTDPVSVMQAILKPEAENAVLKRDKLTPDELTRLMVAMSNDMTYGPSERATDDHMLWRKLERMRTLLEAKP